MASCLWSLSFTCCYGRMPFTGITQWDVPKPADTGFVFYFIQFSSLLYEGCISISIISLAEVYTLTIENTSPSLTWNRSCGVAEQPLSECIVKTTFSPWNTFYSSQLDVTAHLENKRHIASTKTREGLQLTPAIKKRPVLLLEPLI